MYTYVELAEGSEKDRLENQFVSFIDKHLAEDKRKYGYLPHLMLTPLKDVYFQEYTPFDDAIHGDKKTVYIFLSIAALILAIACINFMNLSTVRAVERSKEVGIRKVMGALRSNLISQFIGESILLTLISCVLALALVRLALPAYNHLLGYELEVPWTSGTLYLFLLTVIILVGFLAGSYPALVLSSFSPIQSLKGKLKLGKGGSLFRQTLVVVQFSISVLLILGTAIIMKQMQYVKQKALGYEQEQTVTIPIDNDDFYNHMRNFKNQLQAQSSISSVSFMSGEPGGFFDSFLLDVEGHAEKFKARTEFADFEFVKTLGLKIIAGRDFSSQFPTDTMGAVLLNRMAVQKLGCKQKSAIGKWVMNPLRHPEKRRVIGVVENFNFTSLRENIEPLVISPAEDRRIALIKIKAGRLKEGLELVKKQYATDAPQYPLDFGFLDQKFDELYRKDIKQQTLLSVFSGLAIFIACLGLFGLTTFTTTKRFKEIAIRKVLRSSAQNIVLLLSKHLLKPLFIPTLLPLPIGYFVMSKWLANFAYRTPLPWWLFVLAALITLAIALITVCANAVKAAMANPVKSLKTE